MLGLWSLLLFDNLSGIFRHNQEHLDRLPRYCYCHQCEIFLYILYNREFKLFPLMLTRNVNYKLLVCLESFIAFLYCTLAIYCTSLEECFFFPKTLTSFSQTVKVRKACLHLRVKHGRLSMLRSPRVLEQLL